MKNFFLLLFFALSTGFYAQNTYTVDNKPGAPADFTGRRALQEAIDSVPAGSTLLVQGGPYYYYGSASSDIIEVSKPLTIIGTGYLLEDNPDTQAFKESAKIKGMNILAGAEGTIISGFDFNTYRLYINCNQVTVKNCYFHIGSNINNRYAGIIIYTSEETMIQNCFLPYNYINIQGNVSNIVFYGNYLGQYSDISSGASSVSVSLINNTLGPNFNHALSSQALIAYNNIFLAPDVIDSNYHYNNSNVHHNIFVGGNSDHNGIHGNLYELVPATFFIPDTDSRYSEDGQFILSDNSPASGAGENGRDCGMFGGGYKLSGIPNIPNVYEFIVPDTGYTNDGGIPITIKVKANN